MSRSVENRASERSTRVGLSRRTYARPRISDISVADTPRCRQIADQVVSSLCRRRQRLCRRGTSGTFHNEQSAPWCTVCWMRWCTGNQCNWRRAGVTCQRDAQLRFVGIVEGRSLSWQKISIWTRNFVKILKTVTLYLTPPVSLSPRKIFYCISVKKYYNNLYFSLTQNHPIKTVVRRFFIIFVLVSFQFVLFFSFRYQKYLLLNGYFLFKK